MKEEVQTVQQFLTDNMDVMHNVYPVVSKYFLQKRGLNISTFTRRKVGDLSPKVVKEVEILYDDYTSLGRSLDINVSIC
jgi:4-hydroxy-tetrahydrodipicolinate synthase